MAKRVDPVQQIRDWFRLSDYKEKMFLLRIIAADLGLKLSEPRKKTATKKTTNMEEIQKAG